MFYITRLCESTESIVDRLCLYDANHRLRDQIDLANQPYFQLGPNDIGYPPFSVVYIPDTESVDDPHKIHTMLQRLNRMPLYVRNNLFNQCQSGVTHDHILTGQASSFINDYREKQGKLIKPKVDSQEQSEGSSDGIPSTWSYINSVSREFGEMYSEAIETKLIQLSGAMDDLYTTEQAVLNAGGMPYNKSLRLDYKNANMQANKAMHALKQSLKQRMIHRFQDSKRLFQLAGNPEAQGQLISVGLDDLHWLEKAAHLAKNVTRRLWLVGVCVGAYEVCEAEQHGEDAFQKAAGVVAEMAFGSAMGSIAVGLLCTPPLGWVALSIGIAGAAVATTFLGAYVEHGGELVGNLIEKEYGHIRNWAMQTWHHWF